ncbi:hypothetical protein KC973_02270 [Candidatus Saccharibacteria bacterium]|nr:hypothetical protein [Candidatus Saccharibacteria bacterium]
MDLYIPSEYLVGSEDNKQVVRVAREVYKSNAAHKYLFPRQLRRLRYGTPLEMRRTLHMLYWKRLEACRRYAKNLSQFNLLTPAEQAAIRRPTHRKPALTRQEHMALVDALYSLKAMVSTGLKAV